MKNVISQNDCNNHMLLFKLHWFGAFDLDPDAFSPAMHVLCISHSVEAAGCRCSFELQRERDHHHFILCSHFISSPNHCCLVFLDGSQDTLKAWVFHPLSVAWPLSAAEGFILSAKSSLSFRFSETALCKTSSQNMPQHSWTLQRLRSTHNKGSGFLIVRIARYHAFVLCHFIFIFKIIITGLPRCCKPLIRGLHLGRFNSRGSVLVQQHNCMIHLANYSHLFSD